MDVGTALITSLVLSTLAGWMTSWVLGVYLPDVTGGPRAVLVLLGSTIVGVPADYAAEWAADHQTGVGIALLAVGSIGAGLCGWLLVRQRRAA